MSGETAPTVGLSVLLIGGASTTNITVGDSVGASCARLRRRIGNSPTIPASALTIQEVEIIELYADTAIGGRSCGQASRSAIGNELDTDIAADAAAPSGVGRAAGG